MAPVNKSPSQSDPVQLGTIWFLSGPQSSLMSRLIMLSLLHGAACSGRFVQSPPWAPLCNPKATARQGKGQFSWWSQSCSRKTHYNNNCGISRDETVRAEWKLLSQRGWEMLLQLRGKGTELQGKGCGIADGCLWHHTGEGA